MVGSCPLRLDSGWLYLYCKVFLSLFLTIDYYLKRKWWLSLATEKEPPSLQEYLNSRKEEELLVQTYINGLLQEHQQTMQQAINNQQDQKITLTLGFMKSKSPSGYHVTGTICRR